MFRFWTAEQWVGFYVGQEANLEQRTGYYRSHTGSTNVRIRASRPGLADF